ncbi:MAG: hypothetical protein GC159_02780 [Phycisphaera sp.]|nr:hypothetical protein [Phycisphaera sp.]
MKSRLGFATLALAGLTLSLGALPGCHGGVIDGAKPVAQFESADAVVHAGEYLGKKITVRGVVTSIIPPRRKDSTECVVELDGCVFAVFDDYQTAKKACKVGETVYIDGVVDEADGAEIDLKSVVARDPKAPFTPTR